MSTRDQANEQYRKALIDAAVIEEAHGSALALLADELDREGFENLATALRQVSRHHRAQVIKHRALAEAISTSASAP